MVSMYNVTPCNWRARSEPHEIGEGTGNVWEKRSHQDSVSREILPAKAAVKKSQRIK